MILSSLLLLAIPNVVLSLLVPQQQLVKPPKARTSLPVVLWHGMGDNYDSKGMASVAALINETYPGTFVHSIYVDLNTGTDRKAGFFGHVAEQVSPPPIKYGA